MSTTATAQQWWLDHTTRIGDPWCERYWQDWRAPHRQQIGIALSLLPGVTSLYEIGCASGPNLRLIKRAFPEITVGGLEPVRGAAAMARNRLGIAVDDATLPDGLPDRPVDVVLSCYTMAYLDPDDAHVTMLKIGQMAQRAVILVEPMAIRGLPVGQCRDDGLPEWRHEYEKTFGALGWRVAWKWPLMPPLQNLNALLVLTKGEHRSCHGSLV